MTPDSASEINGYAWLIRELSAFSAWESHPAHHLAFAEQHGDQILISVRIFDLLEAVFPVTKDVTRYLTAGKFEHDLPFLAMDSLSGKMYKSRFFEETMRLTFMERIYLRGLPFLDPLATDHVVSSLDPSGGFTHVGLPWQWGTNWQWYRFPRI